MKKLYTFIPMLIFALFVTACTPVVLDTTTPALVSASLQNLSTTTPSGGQVVWAISNNPVSLDPIRASDTFSNQVSANIMQGLTAMNPTVPYVDVIGNLAHSWYRADPTTWYFYLREGVYFHDGAYFDAHTVVLNIERALDPDDWWVPQRMLIEMISGAVAVDDYTVRVTTYFPFAPLAATFAHRILFMVSPYAIAQERAGGILVAYNPIGTGPFQLYSHEHLREIILVRNENYWGTPAAPDSVRIVTEFNPYIRSAMLENGEAHFISATPANYTMAQGVPQIDIRLLESNTLDYIGFNMNHPILSDIRVRQGIAYAIDRQTIIDTLADGLGTVVDSPTAPIFTHAPQQEQSNAYDPARAAELLAQAGITPNNRVTLNFWFNEGNSFRGAVGQFLQTSLAPYGIDIVVDAVEWGAYLDQTGEGLHDIFILGWINMSGDAHGAIHPLFHSSNLGHAGNRSFFANEHADYLMDRALASMDDTERDMLYEELVEIINYYQPMVFLRYTLVPVLTNGIDNLQVAFDQTPHFRDVTFR